MEQEIEGSGKKYLRRLPAILISTAVLSFTFWLIIYGTSMRPVKNYYMAQNLFRNQQYSQAREVFVSLGSYRDSAAMAEKLALWEQIQKADTLMEKGQYMDAGSTLTSASHNADDQMKEAIKEKTKKLYYCRALAAMEEGSYGRAKNFFEKAGNYKDSCYYMKLMTASLDEQNAQKQYETDREESLESYDDALRIYDELGDRLDGAAKSQALRYQLAKKLIDDQEYEKALIYLNALDDYRDSSRLTAWTQQALDIKRAEDLITAGEYGKAAQLTERLLQTDFEDIQDAARKVRDTLYSDAKAIMKAGHYDEAKKIFDELGDYLDSARFRKELNEDDQDGQYSDRALIRNAEHFLGTEIQDSQTDTFQGNEWLVNTHSLYGHRGRFWAVSDTENTQLQIIIFRFFEYNETEYKELTESLTRDFGEPAFSEKEEKRSYAGWTDPLYGSDPILALFLDHDYQLVLQIEPVSRLTDSSGNVLEITLG